ncbi:transcriptional repressor, partial [Streptomyces sp. SID7982]|nr:transcriptional repressor [Streptomyces sp. SID7982]
FGFDTDMKHFAIFGRCADCTAAKTAGEATERARDAAKDSAAKS